MEPMMFASDDFFWKSIPDGNATARALFDRHYSRRHYRNGRHPRKFVGPGEYLCLLSPHSDALVIWRKFRSLDGQEGINCAVFRNDGSNLSSQILLWAEERAWEKWPGERLYTYVDPRKVKSTNPGCCFKKAGWKICGQTRKGLLILEKHL